jgi:hypothetical protein
MMGWWQEQEELIYGKHTLNIKDFNVTYDIHDGEYEIDVMQKDLINDYIRIDVRFKRAFFRDMTNTFFQMIKDSAKLHEPKHFSCSGFPRTGKSESMLSLLAVLLAYYNKKIIKECICANSYGFLNQIQQMPYDSTYDSCFQNDEDKTAFGIGSLTKKSKLQDVQNIIAKHNISTISICPTRFANADAHYGLRTLGRNFKNKTVRLMLYDLQENKRTQIPRGMVYLPIASRMLPEWYYKPLMNMYSEKKDSWIEKEISGENDVLGELKKKKAESFLSDEQFMQLKSKKDQLVYISLKCGSEWSRGECEELVTLVKMLKNGMKF